MCDFCSIGGVGAQFEPPRASRLGAERDIDLHQPIATRHQHLHLVARLVLIEPVVEAIGPDAHIVDRDDLVVHVEAGVERRGAAAHA